MKIDRKKIVNKCGYDQVECMLLAKRLSECPDSALISELEKISVWNYGKCELGLWADVLDRLDVMLEYAVTKVGKWMLRLDLPENASLVHDVVTILEFTGHLIEHSIYRYLYGSWNHILGLFGSENMDILLAVLGLSYNFSKRSNYFVRLDPHNKKLILDRLVSIAETWGGAENNFGLAACCNPNHFPETAGNVHFEYVPGSDVTSDANASDTVEFRSRDDRSQRLTRGSRIWSSNEKIVLHALHRRTQSPSQIMEEILSQHSVPISRQMALFARIRLATYFSNPEQRHKCIRARLQALSILSYTFEVDERNLYPSLLDELVEVLELPDGQYMGIKACALRTMTAIVNSHRLGVNWTSLVGSTGLSSYHGTLPSLTRRWVQGLVDGTIDAPGGSTNQQFTTALLSFLYHLACYEENVGPGTTQTPTLNNSGVLDTMLQLIAWHNSRNDCLSYVTRAVRVTDQILMSVSFSRQNVTNILIDRLKYEVELVLNTPTDTKVSSDLSPALNTQRSGLMKSILNLLKRLCLDTEWNEVIHFAMDSSLPDVLRLIFLNGSTHFTPHLALFAMECITNYLYTYPSRISAMQDKNVTTDILTALTSQPLPQNRDFLVQLPSLFNTLALNARGIEAIQQSGVLNQYLETLISPEYLPTMKTKRVRDFLSQVSYNLTSTTGQNLSNSLTANQMSIAVQELLRSHSELKSVVFQGLVACLRRVVELGNTKPASLIVEPVFCVGGPASYPVSTDSKSSSSVHESTADQPRQLTEVTSTFPDTVGGSQTVTNNTEISLVNLSTGVLDEDVIMLSGGEDEGEDDENDVDDLSRATQTRPTTTHSSRHATHILDSRSTSPTSSLNYKDNGSQLAVCRSINLLADGSLAPAYLFLPDFILNTCKFLEKLLPSVMHVTEAMCRHFLDQGGLQVLCDLLRMPGLPYDFPVSAACASLCKIFEDLANSAYLSDVIEPLLVCLDSSLEKLTELQHSNFSMTSTLLREYMDNEHVLLHELVVVASIICILVQIIDHLKPVLRSPLANKWVSRNVLRSLGRLYLSISWEAGVLLRMLFGDKDINELDIGVPAKWSTTGSVCKSSGSIKPGEKPVETSTSASWAPVTDSNTVPQFVEALHIYTLLKPLKLPHTDNRRAFLHQRPELTKAAQRILHVTAFFINSFTELCTAWGRFFSNRNPSNYRRHRTNLLANEQVSSATKYAALSQLSQVLSSVLAWEPSLYVARHHPSAPSLIYAMRYAAVRLSNALLHDTSSKGSRSGIMNVFFVHQGIQRYFKLFCELIEFDLTDPNVREPLTEVLEEWLVCADRIANTEHTSSEATRSTDVDMPAVEAEKFSECIHQNMLFPLEQLCTRTDLQNLLTRRAVEHLISMLVTIVPYLFSIGHKGTAHTQSTDSALTRPSDTPAVPRYDMSDRPSHGSSSPSTQTDSSVSVPESVIQSVTSPTECSTDLLPADPSPSGVTAAPPTQPMDTSEPGSGGAQTDANTSSEALRLMEEMGFSRELATIALEQTGWSTNEAVNLLIATPVQDLLANVATSGQSARRTFGWTGSTQNAPRRRDANEVGEDSSMVRSASAIAAAAMQLASAASSFISSTESAISHVNATLSRITNMDRSRSSGQALPVLPPTSMISDSSNDLTTLEPMAPNVINELRDSLKQHVFRACYTVARRHNSDQILHRIAELLLSSGEEERYIDELFGFVASNVSERIGFSTFSTTPAAVAVRSGCLDSSASAEEHPIVGLHLIALLFTRCQSLCARLASTHKLPDLLISWLARSDISTGHTNVSITTDISRVSKESVAEYYKTLMLACLILDQYERSIKAMHLRQLSTKLYLNSHSWNWFDDRAMLWHPYATESGRLIDASFHKGELCAYCHISRRPYAIEFPTLSQVNLNSMHRRPVMLFPASSEDSESSPCSPYEQTIINGEIPSSLQPEQCCTIIHTLLDRLKAASQPSSCSTVQPLHSMPSDCANAILRLLLRLVYSNYANAQDMMDWDFLSVLFKFPHNREFSPEYSTFVGALLVQVFDDVPTVTRVMREVLTRMCQFGVPSTFMGIGISSSACRDFFYLLGMCAPLFAKDYECARREACQVLNLSISDGDVLAKTVPKTFIVDSSTAVSLKNDTDFNLSDQQKCLLTQLVEMILQPSSPKRGPNSKDTRRSVSRATQGNGTGGSQSAHALSSTTATPGIDTQPRASDPCIGAATVDTSDSINVVVLGKTDAIRYLIDLVASYRPVAEFVTLYQCTSTPPDTEVDHFRAPSLLAHLFDHQLCTPETTELTTSLLENLILVTCDSTQGAIIAEFKASLDRITMVAEKREPNLLDDSVHIVKNDRLSAHMLFLKRLLALPSPLVDRLVRLIYKYRIPADIAKLIALVDCNLVNTLSTWMVILHTLENLTWVDRQMSKLVTSVPPDRRAGQATTPQTEETTSHDTQMHDAQSIANATATLRNVGSCSPAQSATTTTDLSAAGRFAPGTRDNESGALGIARVYDSDSDDDDEDNPDAGLVEPSNFRLHGSRTSTDVATTAPSGAAALNLVLDEVIMGGADMVLDQSGTETRDGQSWHAGGEQDDSVIFVHDDEDEGSAGQGGVGENSQDEEEDDDVDDDEDGEAVDEDDDADDHDREDEEEEEEEEDDAGGETDDEVITRDSGMTLVLRSGTSGRRLRGSRRPRTEATISVSVTTGRVNSDHEPTASAGESLRVDFQRAGNELDLHDDAHEDSDGIFEEDELDPFDRDEDDADLQVLRQSSNVPIFLNADSRVLRDTNPVVAMVEEVLNLVDAPQANSGIGPRSSGPRRDRFVLAPSEFAGVNIVPPGTSGGSWGLFFPRLGGSINDDGHMRAAPVMASGFPPNTTVFRFGVGSGIGTSVFVTGGNNNRFNSSSANFLTSNSTLTGTGHSQTHLPATLASQHPLLQVPPTLSSDANQLVSGGGSSTIYLPSGNNIRLNRTVVANTSTTPLTSRVSSILPPVLPSSSSASSMHPHRSRGPGAILGPVLFANTGLRSRGPPTRLYAPFSIEPSGYRPHSPDSDSLPSTNGGAATSVLDNFHGGDTLCDHRAGPEADGMVWTMLSNLAEEQPSSVNSALASAFFSQLDLSDGNRPTSRSSSNGLTASQLANYAGYALPASYRRWITLSRMLFGHELMDITLAARYHVHEELARKRQECLNQRLLESERLDHLQPTVDLHDAPIVPDSTIPVESTQCDAASHFMSCDQAADETQPTPMSSSQTPALEPSSVIDLTVQLSVPSREDPDLLHNVEADTASPDLGDGTSGGGQLTDQEAAPTVQQITPVVEPSTSESPTVEPPVQPAPSATVSSTVPAVPMTDEETIQSLIESGMDPSFLDALPDDVQREVIANHRHARRVQQQLSSITLPEHINAEWLAGLPPHIQEEVLIQFRNEQQQQQQRRPEITSSGTVNTTGESAREPDLQPTTRQPESNTAFLAGLSTSLRREVLADIDESQLEMLPPDLAAEARQLRRENEERFARAVQGGMLTHSFASRHDSDRWRSLTSTTGLVGGPGRWDVRFSSINQLLRHLHSSVGGSLGSNAMLLGLQNTSGIRGRHLVDHEGLACLIVLLIACSPQSQQRRIVIPTLNKVFRNLSCHFPTRNWIVGTLLSLFNGLSEKSSIRQSSAPSDSVTWTMAVDPQTSSQTSSVHNDTIFRLGFEAALGCWVRIFHPVDTDTRKAQLEGSKPAAGSRPVDVASVTSDSVSPHRHIIHPQAAVSVSIVLLDTLDELAKAFPMHFYPRPLTESQTGLDGSSTSAAAGWPRPTFWDIFDRLAQSMPCIGSSTSQSRTTRRAHTAGRKRQTSISSKHHGDAGQRVLGSSQELTPQTLVGTPMEVCDTVASTSILETPDSNLPSRQRSSSTFTGSSVDYFVQLANLLCHPMLKDRPSHQERILSILAGIVKEFVLSRAHSNHSSRPSARAVESSSSGQISETARNEAVPVNDDTTVTTGADADLGAAKPSATRDLIGPLQADVVNALCQFVSDSKSTEAGRDMAAQLITDLARANEQNKKLMLHLLSESAAQLSETLCTQLQELSDEIDLHKKDLAVPKEYSFVQPSSSSTRTASSFDMLPDRFSDSGQLVIISGEPRPNPSFVFSELQLKSVQMFSSQNSCQSRFRGILSIIIRVAAGECSTNATDAIPVCNEDPLQSVTTLNKFWSHLSCVFEKLQMIGDASAVLLLQPLLEAFCLAHLYLVRDSILIRQRPITTRSGRPNLTGATSSQSLVDMTPTLQLRVELPTTLDRTETSQIAATGENTTHLHLDIMGPVSPASVPMDDGKSSATVHCGVTSATSPVLTCNAILQFAERHRSGLNQILRQSGGALGESPFAVFLVYPRVLDFDIKRRFFRQQLQSLSPRSPLSNRYDDEPVVISRDRIFEDSYARLHRKSPAEWKHKFVIRFQNEEGQDAGGPLREWYLLMSREIFNPNYCLFRTSPADRVTYTINPSSYINSNHLSYFKFVGRFIAKAIYDNKLLECYFSRSFYKHILGVPVRCSDMESEDYEFYKGLEFLLTHHISELGYELTFSTEINEFGKTVTRDLIESGHNIYVTEQTKREYIRLVCQEKMTGAIRQQLDAFLTGFYEIVPKRMISIFNEQELELLISGLPNIDVSDLKTNTTYSKYQSSSPQIEWFWRALESFDQEDRARFLQFVTGTSKVPLGGFANLEGMHGPTKFQITQASASTTSHLPCAHTCFNTLVLPAYESYDQLRSRLLIAIRECSEGYGMA